ncbi:hypothetical protein AX17_007445 [Amanita inopinata Kibby_2008]|nr:hypothetical protein AX17_007445 [Amanita inopinata Kibby_2008]
MQQRETEASRPPLRRRTEMYDVNDALQQETHDIEDVTAHTVRTTLDEQLLISGAEGFQKFEKKTTNLDKELHNFANAARQLGSSVAVLTYTFKLRERLARVLYLYRENAATLFPRYVTRRDREGLIYTQHPSRNSKKSTGTSNDLKTGRGSMTIKILKPEDLPAELGALGNDIDAFCDSLTVFPDLLDSAISETFDSFQTDVEYWAACLEDHKHQLRNTDVQRYIHGISQMMNSHLDEVTIALDVLIRTGVPTVQYVQKHSAANLLNLSTVATFFSAVTATTLQYSYQVHATATADATNSFWFASLVFSISAAVNSLLRITWKQAVYRSPRNQVPLWVVLWIERSPVVFLVCAITCFSLGLCCFAFSSNQDMATKVLTAILTGLTLSGLAAVSAWVALERWIFFRHLGHKLASDVFKETRAQIGTALYKALSWVMRTLYSVYERHLKHKSTTGAEDRPNYRNNQGKEILGLTEQGISVSVPPSPLVEPPVESPKDMNGHARLLSPSSPSGSVESPTIGRQLRRAALIRMSSMVYYPMGMKHDNNLADDLQRRGTIQSNMTYYGRERRLTTIGEDGRPINQSRIAGLASRLEVLRTIGGHPSHIGPVHHLQFSPNGQFLATAGHDEAIIHRLLPDEPHLEFRHSLLTRASVTQIAWSPTGHKLITKLERAFMVWTTTDAVRQSFVKRPELVRSVIWLPKEDGILSVESNYVVKISVEGVVLDKYWFGPVKIHDVAVTPDGLYLVAAVTVLGSHHTSMPRKSQLEKRLVVYNIGSRGVESHTPVIEEVRRVVMPRNQQSDFRILISSENAPPEVWRLERSRVGKGRYSMKLYSRRIYAPKQGSTLFGSAYFGGLNDEVVACAGKSGEIHVWDQESGGILHRVHPLVHASVLTCMTWNRANAEFMFATGDHDGEVQLWKQPDLQIIHEENVIRSNSPVTFLSEDEPNVEDDQGVTQDVEWALDRHHEN